MNSTMEGEKLPSDYFNFNNKNASAKQSLESLEQ